MLSQITLLEVRKYIFRNVKRIAMFLFVQMNLKAFFNIKYLLIFYFLMFTYHNDYLDFVSVEGCKIQWFH